MRPFATACLVGLLAAGFAGCLAGGEDLDPTTRSPDANASQTPNETSPANVSSANDTQAANASSSPSDDTGTANATEDTDRTDPGDLEDRGPPELPANLTMDGADVVERTPERVRFRWTGSVGVSEPGDTALAARTTFDVPDGIPLLVNASLTWSDRSSLELTVDGKHVERYCSSGTASPGLEGGSEACQVRTFARSSWDEWGVRVDGEELGEPVSPRPANFTVTLTIKAAEPWTGPPVEAPQSTPGATTDPGWPPIGEAEVRPGTKVGAGGSGTNLGTGNFVFSTPDNRTLYLGWIAHGVGEMEPGDTVELPTAGVEATLVYCSWGAIEETVTCPILEYAPERAADVDTHPRFFNDFALLRLPSSARPFVHPATPVWGGPTAVASPPSRGTQLAAFGNTPFRDGGQAGVNLVDPIRGAAWSSTSRSTEAHLAPQPVPGDSGSPVQTASGQALGTISAIGPPALRGAATDPRLDASAATTIVPNIANAVEVMENETALDVELKTWPLFDQPRAGDLADAPAGPEP